MLWLRRQNQFVTDTYVRAVRISGGIPLLIPILPQDFPINSYLDDMRWISAPRRR